MVGGRKVGGPQYTQGIQGYSVYGRTQKVGGPQYTQGIQGYSVYGQERESQVDHNTLKYKMYFGNSV